MEYTKEQIERIKEELEEVTERELEKMYRNMLNEVYGTVSIYGYEYDAAEVLLSIDSIAYGCGYSDWLGTSEELTEVDGEYYKTEEVNDLVEKMEDEKLNQEEGEDV